MFIAQVVQFAFATYSSSEFNPSTWGLYVAFSPIIIIVSTIIIFAHERFTEHRSTFFFSQF